MTVHFILPEERHAGLLFDWRRRPDIADKMLAPPPESFERHLEWFRRCGTRDDYLHRILCEEDVPLGYVSITITQPQWRIASLGTLMGQEGARIGAAVTFFAYALNHIFFTLGMRKVVNQILDTNDRVWRGQTIIGYRHVGTHRGHVLRQGQAEESAEDLHVFEMARADWIEKRRRFGIFHDMDGASWPD